MPGSSNVGNVGASGVVTTTTLTGTEKVNIHNNGAVSAQTTTQAIADLAGGGGGGVSHVATGTGLTGGPITTTGTISLDTRTASTLMGNPGTAAAAPTDIVVGSGLVLSSGGTLVATASGGSVTNIATGTGLTGGPITTTGTVSLDTRTASTLMGNPGTAAATPTDIVIGSGLSLSAGGTLTATASGFGKFTGTFTTNASIGTAPVNSTLLKIRLANTTANPVTINVGTTSGGAEIYSGASVPGTTVPVTISVFLVDAWAAGQAIFVNSSNWNSASVDAIAWYLS